MEPRCHWQLCCIPSGLLPRVKARDAAELFPQRTFFVAELLWQLHVGDHVQVAAFADALSFGQTAPAHAKLVAVVCAGRDAHIHPTLECWNADGSAQHGFPRRNVQLVIKIRAAHAEVRMRRKSHAQVEVARRAAVRAFVSFARDADGLALLHAGGNADFESVRFGLASARIGALERNGAHRAVHHFVERDEDIAFDITAACRAAAAAELFRAEPLFAEGKPEAASATEESLEEVTEARATEVELEVPGAVGTVPGAVLLARWRLEAGAWRPIRAEFIVALALLWVAEDFVGFVDLLELFLGGLLVLGHVGMVLAGQLAKGFLDLFVAGITRHSEGGVVIFEFNRHGGGLRR